MSGPRQEGVVPVPPRRAARYRRAGLWTGESLVDAVLAPAAAEPGRAALVDGDVRMTHGELAAASGRLALRLRWVGIGSRDRVVVQLPNGEPFVTLLLALWRLGAIPVLALPAHREHELRHLLAVSGAAALAVPARLHRGDHLGLARALAGGRRLLVSGAGADPARGEVDLAEAARGPGPALGTVRGPAGSEVALLLLSGGTTGLPKLIPRTHDDYGCNLRLTAGICGLDARAVYLTALPAAHNFGLGCPGVLGALASGGRVVFTRSPGAARTVALMTEERVTIAAAVPTLAAAWADAVEAGATRPGDLALLQVGGARPAPAEVRRLRRVLGCRVQQVYGMAEGLVCLTRSGDPDEVVAETQGRPAAPEDELRIVDGHGRNVRPGETGELWTRGPCTIAGYYRAPEHDAAAFAPGGWLRTGDLVRLHPSGGLVVEGRIKDVINRAGEKIAAAELEELALGHPAIARAAAVAMPDPVTGEAICLFVVARAGGRPTLDGIRAHLDAVGVARFKLPDRLEVLPELPLTAVGKVDRAALRWLAARAGACAP
jgi:2,3-dihydroxybenzoate-AMP ligase